MSEAHVVPLRLTLLLALLVPDPDLAVSALSGLTTLGRSGSFPTGVSGLSLSPTVCNLGAAPAPWMAAMSEAHPGVALAMYRVGVEGDGITRLRQIGLSWVHHGFFALAQNACGGGCGGSGDPTALPAGCSNVSSASIVGDRFLLGPRREWNAHTGAWTCLGSYFDGTPIDCVRDEDGTGLDPVAHRLVVADAELTLPGASFYVEAQVLEVGDATPGNDLAHRACTPLWTGATWLWQLPAAEAPAVPGPAVQRWGDLHSIAAAGPEDGRLQLAVQVTQLGAHIWRYEYALLNESLAGRVDALRLPLPPGANTPFFADVDDDPTNDWSFGFTDGLTGWTLPAGIGNDVEPGGGPLEFGVLYAFGFTSGSPPVPGNAQASIFDPRGATKNVSLPTLIPTPLPGGHLSRPGSSGPAGLPGAGASNPGVPVVLLTDGL